MNNLKAAIDTLDEFYQFNKTLTPRGNTWLEASVNISRYAQEALGKALPLAITALREKQQRQPDPITGLVPCGCGGKAKIWLSDFTRFTYLITDYEVGCTECAMTTGWVRGKQENAMNVWNTAMGWKGGSK